MGQHYRHLGAEERGTIMAMKRTGASTHAIAAALQRAQSTIVRELQRNGYTPPPPRRLRGRPAIAGGYDATRAGERARRLLRIPRTQRKLRPDGVLWPQVWTLLTAGWSPQQTASKLRERHPDQPELHVSHETIYAAIYAMPRGELRRQHVALLRQARGARRPLRRSAETRGKLPDMPSIHSRPPEVDARLVPGHWEGDLIMGARNRSAVGVVVCRHSLFVMLARLERHTARGVLEGFTRTFLPLPPDLLKTLTYDQGKEMALHRMLSAETGLDVYFADPRSPWQRGICENTNGLLRQYLPKGEDLSEFSQQDLDRIAMRLNMRPRKTLKWRFPSEVFLEKLLKRPVEFSIEDALRY
ncbi:IS30 family transposase [Luteimonas sp. WGS1318]|uniref:IS30 family transposase n=1 Tax=Luteimonas sp. WGS1318 TaxID=3366815 RepID=UPI00372D2990